MPIPISTAIGRRAGVMPNGTYLKSFINKDIYVPFAGNL
jgi:hypothetical protein